MRSGSLSFPPAPAKSRCSSKSPCQASAEDTARFTACRASCMMCFGLSLIFLMNFSLRPSELAAACRSSYGVAACAGVLVLAERLPWEAALKERGRTLAHPGTHAVSGLDRVVGAREVGRRRFVERSGVADLHLGPAQDCFKLTCTRDATHAYSNTHTPRMQAQPQGMRGRCTIRHNGALRAHACTRCARVARCAAIYAVCA